MGNQSTKGGAAAADLPQDRYLREGKVTQEQLDALTAAFLAETKKSKDPSVDRCVLCGVCVCVCCLHKKTR